MNHKKLGRYGSAFICLWWSAGFAGEISGSVKFAGKPPVMAALKVSNDPVCCEPGRTPPTREDVIVNENATLRNVIVYVKEGLPSSQASIPPSDAMLLDQSGCVFEPHVFALQTGQELRIRNSDNTVHNVNTVSKINSRLNFMMLNNKVPPSAAKFAAPELPIRFKCDVHPWMQAYCGVFSHPYFAVTGKDGRFEIKGLPAGEYTVEAWQEKYGTQQMKIKIGADEKASLDFQYSEPGAPIDLETTK